MKDFALQQRTPLRIRPLRRGDVEFCAAMIARTPLWQRYRYGEERCARDLRAGLADRDQMLVALLGGEVAGLAWVLPRGGFGRVPYLKLLAVSAEARGRGVGAALLQASHSSGDLLLLVSDFNRRARRFYAALGYQKVGAIPDLVLPGVTEVLMFKREARRRTPSLPFPGKAGEGRLARSFSRAQGLGAVTESNRRRKPAGRAGAGRGTARPRVRSGR
jgi:GNAT superfamily N-acetyltransferase